MTVVILTSGCVKSPDSCNSNVTCKQKVIYYIKNKDIKSAITFYEIYKEYNHSQEDFFLLNKIATETSKAIFEGDIDFGKKIDFLYFADSFYSKSGIPFVSERIGVKDIVQEIEYRKMLAKALTAVNLYNAGQKNSIDDILPLLENEEASIRGSTAVCVGAVENNVYLNALDKVYKTDKKDFVRYYALRALGYQAYDKYKEELLKAVESEDPLAQTLAAGPLIKNGEDQYIDIIKQALMSNDEILILRAIEALIKNNMTLEGTIIISYLDSDNFLRRYLTATLLGKIAKPEYVKVLKNKLNDPSYKCKLSVASGLLESDNTSGLKYIYSTLASESHDQRIFASKAIIEHYNRITKSTSEKR
jgi:hypothetical protein